MILGVDPDDEDRRVLAPVKSNLAAPACSLAFTLEQANNGAVRVDWQGETYLTAEDHLAGPEDEFSSLEEAQGFLIELLVNGPVAYKEVEASAKQAGVNMRTVKRAKRELGVLSVAVREEGKRTPLVVALQSGSNVRQTNAMSFGVLSLSSILVAFKTTFHSRGRSSQNTARGLAVRRYGRMRVLRWLRRDFLNGECRS